MGKIFRSKYFWLFAILIAAGVFSFGINSKKTYQADVKILTLPKSERAALSADQAIENALEIPRSLSFYDKLAELNPDIENQIRELPDHERRAAWNSALKTERIGESGILVISAYNDDQIQAESLATLVARDLRAVMGRYYDPETELDMRIIDGPTVYLVSKNDLGRWALMGLLAGFVVSLAIFLPFSFSSDRTPSHSGREEPRASLKDLEKFDFKKTPKAAGREKKAPAPENLPTHSAQEIDLSKEREESGKASPDTEEAGTVHREPTQEEVRERLNRLLRGN